MAVESADGRVASNRFKSLEICAGAGGLALGLEQAGFDPILLIDNRDVACETLRFNRPGWDVREVDLLTFDPDTARHVYDVDLLSGGLPRVKSPATAGRARGDDMELAVLRAAVDLVHAVQPRVVLFENVPELIRKDAFAEIRAFVTEELDHLGYRLQWRVVDAAHHGVPQHREVGLLVAFKGDLIDRFVWPEPRLSPPPTLGEALRESMGADGWIGVDAWAALACEIAPTIIGGSWERGGADLGPSGAKRKWARWGVDGGTIGDAVPPADFLLDPSLGREGLVPLTVEQVALLQGFPPDWTITGRKTRRYRQVGNATPPPLARVLGAAVVDALTTANDEDVGTASIPSSRLLDRR
ncbi:DNA cytosine methyltransferase [Streptomyces sp. NPDC052192]|uniref:DNA cytosine methyltransferase n=1 Tax=Streptomyces sp. NPDC052192 TaxID=3155052 RepID=UPI0034333DC8